MTAAGDSGNSFLEGILSASGPDPAKAQEFAAGAKGLLEQAKNGDWAINEAGGTHFRTALEQAEEALDGLQVKMDHLAKAPALGNDPYAKQVAGHVLGAIDSDDQSLVQSYNAFKTSLADMRQALDIAIKNYKQSDEESVQKLGPLMRNLEA